MYHVEILSRIYKIFCTVSCMRGVYPRQLYQVIVKDTSCALSISPPATDNYRDLKFAETAASLIKTSSPKLRLIGLLFPLKFSFCNLKSEFWSSGFKTYIGGRIKVGSHSTTAIVWETLVHYPSRSYTLENSGPLSVKIRYFWELWSVIRQDPILLGTLVRYPSRSDSFCYSGPLSDTIL
ncbi:uncharacterized protein EV154DRAFT_486679 [Mucor mucedo]|uniref:uncharacterized protein n=1 Tax=Mucor mucedo TaxID=29922 RepID=UPI002220F2C2|nr:uncharacterized protein EV154DRAFT_486679 [Mucor mucedo]KAI7875632.1 hypothetical protein EV154DRAFT_486679 [Mucor mucedo]